MRNITITVALALVTFVTALRAAWLWRKASLRMPRLIDFIAGSGDHVVQVEREVYGAVLLIAPHAAGCDRQNDRRGYWR